MKGGIGDMGDCFLLCMVLWRLWAWMGLRYSELGACLFACVLVSRRLGFYVDIPSGGAAGGSWSFRNIHLGQGAT